MSLAVPIASAARAAGPDPIRVMVVDDAVVVRGLVSRWIEEEPGLTVVASLRTGREAVDQLERADPDVVILDVDMPELDGIAALPLLLEKKRDLVVIMASTLTRRNAEISLKALSLGAADYIPKPETNRGRHHLGHVPARADRQDPRARRAPEGASLTRAPPARVRSDPAVAEARLAGAAAAPSAGGRDQAQAVLVGRAARAADRLLDRRPAGAHAVVSGLGAA